jgi:hypothetical protein
LLFFELNENLFYRPSDLSTKRSRSSLHDSMGDFDDKRRTYLVKYDEGDRFAADDDDEPNFQTAV